MRTFSYLALAAILLAGGTAHAHAPSADVGDVYAGLLHALTSIEHVLAFAALGLLGGRHGRPAQPMILLFAMALAVGAMLGLSGPALRAVDLTNLASSVLLGALVAFAAALPPAALYVLTALFGASHGYANGDALAAPISPWLYVPGVAIAGLLVVAYGFALQDFVERRRTGWLHIAVRVAGSWIAAVGLLVFAIKLRTMLAT